MKALDQSSTSSNLTSKLKIGILRCSLDTQSTQDIGLINGASLEGVKGGRVPVYMDPNEGSTPTESSRRQLQTSSKLRCTNLSRCPHKTLPTPLRWGNGNF